MTPAAPGPKPRASGRGSSGSGSSGSGGSRSGGSRSGSSGGSAPSDSAGPGAGGSAAGSPHRPDPVRLAVARAYLAFARGGPFVPEPPAALRGEAQRRLYVQLLRGLVRHRRLLEAEVARLAGRPIERLDAEPLTLAMLGLFQLRFLETAPHAAVFETVALAPALRKTQTKGWINAILRAAQREAAAGERPADALPLAVRTSHPDWMVARWMAQFGELRTQALCEANNRYEGAALRVATQRIEPEALLGRLADEGVGATPHPLLADALWCEQLGPLLDSRSFREGLCYVQDVASQLLLAWTAPLLRGRVLDACAAPGGKLTHLLAAGPPQRWVAAADSSSARLGHVRENLHRLRLPATPLLRADGRRLPCADGAWDAVLIDAPCSATGMVRKYPELKWRKHAEDLPHFAATQAALLDEAARVLRPGGTLLYSTCSLEPEENEQAVQAFLARQRGFSLLSFRELPPPAGLRGDPDACLTAAGTLLMVPAAYQMGLFGALLVRRR